MKKLLIKIKKAVFLPIIAALALGSTTPATAYNVDYNALINRIITLLMPFLRNQNTRRIGNEKSAVNKKDVNSRTEPRTIAQKTAQPKPKVELVQPELTIKPVTPVTPITAPAGAEVVKVVPQPTLAPEHDELMLLASCLDTLHDCVKKVHTCKKQFLDANITRSYKEFKREFDTNLAALRVIAEKVNQKSGEQFRILRHMVEELIQAQVLMCEVLKDDYSSGMTLGLSLAKIEKPTERARGKLVTLTKQLQHMLHGKAHVSKQVKIVATEIHSLLAPPKEQGLSVMTLWGICNKRI